MDGVRWIGPWLSLMLIAVVLVTIGFATRAPAAVLLGVLFEIAYIVEACHQGGRA